MKIIKSFTNRCCWGCNDIGRPYQIIFGCPEHDPDNTLVAHAKGRAEYEAKRDARLKEKGGG